MEIGASSHKEPSRSEVLNSQVIPMNLMESFLKAMVESLVVKTRRLLRSKYEDHNMKHMVAK